MSAPPKAAARSPGSVAAPKRRKLRKEEILAEATRLFAERGYEGASMGDLAERVGLRKASLFHHFPSKEALYAAVLTQLVEKVQRAVMTAVTSEGSFAARLDAISDGLTATLGAQPYAARLLVREVMDSGPVWREQLGRSVEEVLAGSLEFAKAGQRAGEFDSGSDPAQAIVSLIGMHFMPFAISDLIERFTGTSPFRVSFVEERRVAVREQTARMILARAERPRAKG